MEITRENFNEKLPFIQESISSCEFLAIDTELSGLHTAAKKKAEYYDSIEDRYQKCKDGASQFTITQVGLSTFHFVDNKWQSRVFNFYLFPRSYSWVDSRFMCQSTSLEFLMKYNFDFNKAFYTGVGYLSGFQEFKLKQQLEDSINKINTVGNVSSDDEIVPGQKEKEALENLRVQVETWLKSGIEQDLILSQLNSYMRRLVRQEFGKKFKELYFETIEKDGPLNDLKVYKLSEEEKQRKNKEKIEKMRSEFAEAIGFRNVWNSIVKAKKPLVCHNGFFDLLFFYDKFQGQLPKNCMDFRAEWFKLVPYTFDTKYLASEVVFKEKFVSTGLDDVYTIVNTEDMFKNVVVELHSSAERYKDSHAPHEAGYDAYMTGVAFIKIVTAIIPNLVSTNDIVSSILLSSLRNKLNMYAIPPLSFEGEQEEPTFPGSFYVSLRNQSTARDVYTSFQKFSPFEVKYLENNGIIVRIQDNNKIELIIPAFKNNKKIKVEKYVDWKRAQLVKKPTTVSPWFYVAAGAAPAVTALIATTLWFMLKSNKH